MSRITVTKSWLQSRCILVPDDWLMACMEWIEEDNEGTDLNQEKLNDMVYEQWLLSDLHELGTACLPGSVATDAKFQLIGTYALQIDSIIDVSQSYYSQQQKVKGIENANVNVTADKPTQHAWEPKVTRMLMLQLTDGSLTVQGMEYRTIAQLSVTTHPGCKILVQGNILCRHGILMLSGSDLKVLGGEVDILMEQNTPENVLQSAIEKSSKNDEKQVKQEFEGSQIQKSTVRQGINQNSRQPKQTIRQIQQFPQADGIHIDKCRLGVKQEPRGSNQQKTHWQDQMTIETPVLMEMDDEMWEDDFNYEDLLEDMEDVNGLIPESRTSEQRETERNTSFQTVGPIKPQNSFQVNNATTSRSGTRISGEDIAQNVVNDKFSVYRNDTKKMCISNRGIKIQKETVYNAVGMGDSDFEDDMYDFDMDSAIKDDPLTSSEHFQLEYTASERNGGISRSLPQPSGNKPSPTWTSTLKCSTSDRPSVTALKIPEQRSNFSVENLSNKSPTKSKKEQVTPLNTLDKYFGLMSGGSGVRSGDEPTNTSRFNLMERFTEPKSKEVPSAIDVSSAKLLRDKFFLMRTTEQPLTITSNVCLDSQPFTYLSVLQKHLPPSKRFQCSVKAYISTLTGRLDCRDGKIWHLMCKINDGSASMEVDLSNQVLTGLIGFSAEESMIMRKRAKEDPAVKKILSEGLQQCQQKLIDLGCLMELDVTPFHQRPQVKALLDITVSHIDTLYKRVTQRLQ